MLVNRLIEAGHESIMLWVLQDNVIGRRFYEKLGGERISEKTEEIGGKALIELGYGWKNIHLLGENDGESGSIRP